MLSHRVRRVASRIRSDPGLHTVVLLVLLIVAFVPLLDQLPWSASSDVAAPQLTASLARSVPNGGVVLAFPYPRAHNDEPMLWQAADEMSFRLVGGYALVPGEAGRGSYYIAQGPDLSKLSSLLVGPSGASGVPLESACRSLEAVVRAVQVDALVLRTSKGAIRTRAIGLADQALGAAHGELRGRRGVVRPSRPEADSELSGQLLGQPARCWVHLRSCRPRDDAQEVAKIGRTE